jgi:poly(3-hydroxybutyrate) depolymerase
LTYLRDGATKEIKIEPAEETDVIPAKLPQTARRVDASDDDSAAAAKPVPIKIAELKNDAELYVPPEYDDAAAHGLVVLLHPQGGFADKTILDRWRDRCRRANLLLLVPKGVDGRWTPNDLEFIKKTIDRTAESYRVDAARVVVVGYEEGGTVALRAAGSLRERIRGVVVVNVVPTGFNAENEPLYPTSIFTVTAKDFSGLARVKTAVEQLRERHLPVVLRELPKGADDWDDAGAAELLRWLDALDRI